MKNIAKYTANFTKNAKNVKFSNDNKNIYGKLPPKLHDLDPWIQVCLDIIGPWNIKTTNNKAPVTLLALKVIDSAKSWCVKTPLPNKETEAITIAFDQQWICKNPTIYPWQLYRVCGYWFSRNASLLWNSSSDYDHRNPQANTII